MLPEELSEVLGVSLSNVLARHYSGSDVSKRGRLIGDALDRKRMGDEDREWLEGESRKWDHEELYCGEPDDTY
jgi:hypothetical protein